MKQLFETSISHTYSLSLPQKSKHTLRTYFIYSKIYFKKIFSHFEFMSTKILHLFDKNWAFSQFFWFTSWATIPWAGNEDVTFLWCDSNMNVCWLKIAQFSAVFLLQNTCHHFSITCESEYLIIDCYFINYSIIY